MTKMHESIDDWEIIKEYKQKKLEKQKAAQRDYKAKMGKFTRGKTNTEIKLKKEEAANEQRIKQFENESTRPRAKTRLKNKIKVSAGKVKDLKGLIDDYDHDIELATKLHNKMPEEIAKTEQEIEKVKAKIDELKRKEKTKKKTATKKTGKTTEKCPKKCRIENIKIKCSHKRSIEVPVYEPGMGIPYLNVLSGSQKKTYDIVDIDFGGKCDHGKSTKADDSEQHELFERVSGYKSYCPRVEVFNEDTQTSITRPSTVKFVPALKESSIFSSGTLRLLTDLIFCRDEAKQDYDLQFESCTGSLPYKARVTAHPQWEWKFAMSFGYKEATKVKASRYSEEKGIWNTVANWVSGKPEDYNDVETSGEWLAEIKGGYTYDIHTPFKISHTYKLKELTEELSESWSFLEATNEFFKPLAGFFELTNVTNKKAKDDGHEIATVEIQYPKLEVSGGAKNIEIENSPEIGVQGNLSIGFAPLFGIKGEIDIIQVCLASLGGPLGVFLRKASNMSIGTKDEEGKLDTKKNYIKTNLELKVGAESNVSGNLEFESKGESLWQGTDSAAANIKGIVALILKGSAKIDGHVWVVKFECGAEFRTASEDGNGNSGIEVSIKPAFINQQFTAVGNFTFTGLSVIYALFKKAEAAGLEEDKGSTQSMGLPGAPQATEAPPEEESKTAVGQETETYRKHVLFSKRDFPLFKFGEDTASVNAKYKTHK